MKKPSNSALATGEFENQPVLLFPGPNIVPRKKPEAGITVSTFRRSGKATNKKRGIYIEINRSAETIKDFLFLLAAILIITIIHRYIPNTGTVPRSIVDVVKSAESYAKQN